MFQTEGAALEGLEVPPESSELKANCIDRFEAASSELLVAFGQVAAVMGNAQSLYASSVPFERRGAASAGRRNGAEDLASGSGSDGDGTADDDDGASVDLQGGSSSSSSH